MVLTLHQVYYSSHGNLYVTGVHMSLYQQVTEKTQFRELLWQREQASCEPDNLGPHSAGQNGRSAVRKSQTGYGL